MARLIVCEAGGEGLNGMLGVAGVVMNRVRTREGEYGRYNTVSDVINAARQFTCLTSDVRNIWIVSPDELHYQIAEWALNGGSFGAIADSLWFFNPYSEVCPYSFPNNSGMFFTRIGDHCYYRPTGAYSDT